MTNKTEFSTATLEAIKDAYQRGLAVGEAQGYNKALAEVATTIRKMPAAKAPNPQVTSLQPLAPLSTTLKELELEVRPYNHLMRAGIRTIGDILEHAKHGGLYDIKNFGLKSQAAVAAKLAGLGYEVSPNPYPQG